MPAHVPFIPRLDFDREPLASHVWTIVLTGDAPPAPPRPAGGDRRAGARRATATPPGRRLERVSRLAPAGQTITVLTRRHAAAWASELASVPGGRAVVEPSYRGRAAELVLPLLRIARRDPSATIVVVPADHRVEHDTPFLRGVSRAVWSVALRPDVPILIAARPGATGRDGWVEPGAPIDGLESLDVYAVEAFIDDALPQAQRRLLDGGALVSTGILVARAGTLRAVAARTLPDVVEALEPLEDAFDRPEEALLVEAVYECMPRTSLASLERAPGLAVLALPRVVWRRTPELQLAS